MYTHTYIYTLYIYKYLHSKWWATMIWKMQNDGFSLGFIVIKLWRRPATRGCCQKWSRNLKVRDTQDPYHPNRKMFVDIPGILIGHRFWHNYRNLCSCMGKLFFIEDRVYGLDQSMMEVVPPTISPIIIITHKHCPSHTNINNNHNPQYIWVNLELSMVCICLYNH